MAFLTDAIAAYGTFSASKAKADAQRAALNREKKLKKAKKKED